MQVFCEELEHVFPTALWLFILIFTCNAALQTATVFPRTHLHHTVVLHKPFAFIFHSFNSASMMRLQKCTNNEDFSFCLSTLNLFSKLNVMLLLQIFDSLAAVPLNCRFWMTNSTLGSFFSPCSFCRH